MSDTERKQYFPDSGGACLELRAQLAWELIEEIASGSYGPNGPLFFPEQIINNAFAIADAFVDAAEQRGELRAPLSAEERADQIAADVFNGVQRIMHSAEAAGLELERPKRN